MRRELAQALHLAGARQQLVRRQGVVDLQRAAEIEPVGDLLQLDAGEVAGEDIADGAADDVAGDVVGAAELALVFELELAGNGRQRRIDVGDARRDDRLVGADGAPLGARDHVLEQRDRQPLADAGALVDLLVLPRLERDFLDHLADERRDLDRAAAALEPRFLRRDRHRILAGGGVVRPDLGADAVLQRRDDLAARGVVLRVGAEHQHDVERQADRVALDLDVPFLKDVEQPDLDLAGEVRQLVDGEHAAVGPRQQAVVHRQLVGELQPGSRRLDRVEIADQVGDRDVRRRQLLDVAAVAIEPRDRQVVALGLHPGAARGADRAERIVVDLAARNDRDLGVEQIGERPQDPALRLAAQAEQDEVVPRQNRVHDLRHDGVVVADDARKDRLAAAQALDQVVADFVLDAAPRGCGRMRRRREAGRGCVGGRRSHGLNVKKKRKERPYGILHRPLLR